MLKVSEARVEANKKNSRKSRGPCTQKGKEASRANSYQHGLTGAGVVVHPSDAAELERRVAAYRADFHPKGQAQDDLVRRSALMMIRMEKCAAQEAEATATRVRDAQGDFDDARHEEADWLMANLASHPEAHFRRLKRTPEGIDRLLIAWAMLKTDLVDPSDHRLDAARIERAEHLSGRAPGGLGMSRFEALLKAVRGRSSYLQVGDAEGLEGRELVQWAVARLLDLVDLKVADLVAAREAIDFERIAANRAGTSKVALFDPSREANLARKYEAAAERSYHRAIRELKSLQKQDSAPRIPTVYPNSQVASFSRPDFVADLPPLPPSRIGSDLPSNDLGIVVGRPPRPRK